MRGCTGSVWMGGACHPKVSQENIALYKFDQYYSLHCDVSGFNILAHQVHFLLFAH